MIARLQSIRRARAVSYYATGHTPDDEEIRAELDRAGAGLSKRQLRSAYQADDMTRSVRSLYPNPNPGPSPGLSPTPRPWLKLRSPSSSPEPKP